MKIYFYKKIGFGEDDRSFDDFQLSDQPPRNEYDLKECLGCITLKPVTKVTTEGEDVD